MAAKKKQEMTDGHGVRASFRFTREADERLDAIVDFWKEQGRKTTRTDVVIDLILREHRRRVGD